MKTGVVLVLEMKNGKKKSYVLNTWRGEHPTVAMTACHMISEDYDNAIEGRLQTPLGDLITRDITISRNGVVFVALQNIRPDHFKYFNIQ